MMEGLFPVFFIYGYSWASFVFPLFLLVVFAKSHSFKIILNFDTLGECGLFEEGSLVVRGGLFCKARPYISQ